MFVVENDIERKMFGWETEETGVSLQLELKPSCFYNALINVHVL